MLQEIQRIDDTYPKPVKKFKYGTAGFRDRGEHLTRAFFRVGLGTAIRAKQVGTVGIMITASHNPYYDNGVKIVEPDGSILVHRWEEMMEHLVNADDIGATLDNVSNSTVKAWSLGVNIFDNQPVPPLAKA